MLNHPPLHPSDTMAIKCCFSSPCMAKMSPKIPFPLKYLIFSHDYPAVPECALWEGGQCPFTSPQLSTKCLFSTVLPQKVHSSKQQKLFPSPAPVCVKKTAVTHLMKADHYLFKDLIGHYFILTSKT